MYVGKKIKQLRHQLELTQEDFSNQIGISRQHYISIETGKKPISKRLSDKIASTWGVELESYNPKLFIENRFNEGVNKGGFKGGNDFLKDDIKQQVIKGRQRINELIVASIDRKNNALIDKAEQSISKDYPHLYINKQNLKYLIVFHHALENIFEEIYGPLETEHIGKISTDINTYKNLILKDLEKLTPYENALSKFVEAIKIFYKDLEEAGINSNLEPYL